MVFDSWLRNESSAKKVQNLAKKAKKAGAQGVGEIAAVGKDGELTKNMARELKRRAARKSKMPPLYYAAIPCWDDDEKRCIYVDIPFLLPTEVIFNMIAGSVFTLLQLVSIICNQAMAATKRSICQNLQTDPHKHILIGLHTEGVPMQRSGATIEVNSFNFPQLPKAERMLWNLLEKVYYCRCGCSGRHTLDKIFELLLWNLESMFTGTVALERRDKMPWTKRDNWRKKLAGKALGFVGSVSQYRADWMALKQVFSFGGWNALRMCFCW